MLAPGSVSTGKDWFPMPMGVYPRPTLEERFWNKVDRSGGPNACWPWTPRARMTSGYGLFATGSGSHGTGVSWGAHRVAYWLSNYGTLPPRRRRGDTSESVCHSCDNKSCCNPAHLWLGDAKVNAKDASSKGLLFQPGKRLPPEKCAKTKLTWEIVRSLRTGELSGMRRRHVARLLNVDESTIYNVRTYKTWKDR